MSTTVVVDNNYQDIYAPKEFVENELVPKYFGDIDASLRTVGMIGYTTELVTNISEDSFNAGAVLFRESFPNRAQIPESIYSHAAIFQLSNVFSIASSCRFLLVLEEKAIIKNMVDYYDTTTGIYHFYIDKNTKIYVEDKVFTLDYDIVMNIVKTQTENGVDYLFTAKYNMDEYKNSISEIIDPYVKIRRSSDGFIALEVQTHQCVRDIQYESLVSSNMINFPVIDINFSGKLAGFDILYKKPSDTEYTTQLDTKIVYSQATKEPFCYYQMVDEDTLRITFNSKDNYFIPVFNSELKIILYITDGSEGTFDVYNGTDISLIPDNEVYNYANTYLTAAQPIGSSEGGQDQMEVESLQELTVEQYRTATALTTEHDLNEYFSNYKYRYGDAYVMFIKKRDDACERVYSSFLMIRNGDYLYNTNTLNLKINLDDMRNVEKNVWVLDPGYLFTCNNTDGLAEFYRDEEKSNEYYETYLKAIEDGDPEVQYIDPTIVDPSQIPAYLDRECSFATYKSRYGLDDKVKIFDVEEDWLKDQDFPAEGKFMLINPFLIRFKKEPNLVSTYMTYIRNASLVDFTDQNEESYIQFVLHTLYLNREFSIEKKYEFYTKIGPSISIDAKTPIIQINGMDEFGEKGKYVINDKYNVVNNDLRVIMLIKDKSKNICFTELYPTDYANDAQNFTFSGEMYTDDHITAEGRVRIESGTIYRNPETGEYYKVYSDDYTKYYLYDKDDNIIASDIPVDTVTEKINDGTVVKWSQVINMTASDDILIPMTDVTCEIHTLYKRHYDQSSGGLIYNSETSNIFAQWDPTLENYIWTNKYSTASEPITFIKPLDSIRTYLTFDDYTEAEEVIDIETGEKDVIFTHDIMDVSLYSISFLRATTALNKDLLDYFMNSFFAQYNALTGIINTTLRNETNIDVKFYNTYGRSKYFLIGEDNEVLDTVNLMLEFDVWYIPGTDILSATPELKKFIKNAIETVNHSGMNNLFISNLIRKIEIKFTNIDHLRFKAINRYSTDYQAVKNYATDLNDLTVEERRFYVPEFLVCDLSDIIINEYYADEKTLL